MLNQVQHDEYSVRSTDTNLSPYRPIALSPCRKAAFTLAEVLITLGIIGVVAALTIPPVVQNYQDKITVAKVKKAYSIFSQAYLQAIYENGPIEEWDCSSFEETSNYSKASRCKMSYLLPYIKNVKYCDNDSRCFLKESALYTLDGNYRSNLTNGGGAYTASADGLTFFMGAENSLLIKTDNKDKNVQNKNLFLFRLMPNKLSAKSFCRENGVTTVQEIQQGYVDVGLSSDGSINKGCSSTASEWILLHSNLDYIRCPDKVSENGPYSCK